MKKLSLGQNLDGTETQIWVSDSEMITLDKTDPTPILEANQRLRNAGGGRKRGLHHVGRVDMVTYTNWKKEWKRVSDKWEWRTFLAMKLRDRDYSKFRTSDMKI